MTQSTSATIYTQYEKLLNNLKDVVVISELRVVSDSPDPLFDANVNFFVKSYLINVCTYLEAYLQDIAYKYSKTLSIKMANAKIPHNFIHWRLKTGIKDKDLIYADASLPITKKDISDEISANPYKTLKLFKLLGVDLSKKDAFECNKDLVNTIVSKRNNIIHHNDAAADVSFGDLKLYIEVIIPYMAAVKEAVEEHII